MNSGCYFLLIQNKKEQTLTIGKLGTFQFPTGFYVYTGSAMANLDKRIERHLSKSKKLHWHVDYLLEHTKIIFSGSIKTAERLECELNKKIEEIKNSRIIVPGFGSSDCKCPTHLFFFSSKSYLKSILKGKRAIEIQGKRMIINGIFR